jgi:signal transduction histidine kinase
VIEANKLEQEQAEKIKVNTVDIIRTLHQIDMGLRGYALIDSQVQLKVATDGFIKMDTVLRSLKWSLQSQGFPMDSFKVMKDSIDLYFGTISNMVSMVRDRNYQDFNEVLRADRGLYTYRAYVRFSALVNRFEDNIASSAKARYDQALRNSYLLQAVLFCIITPALMSMIYLFKKTVNISAALQRAEQYTVKVLASQNEFLEREVKERTYEITAQNEEISAQNEEIVAHNDQLVQQQQQIAEQRNSLVEKNAKLEQAYQTIESQHNLIQTQNDALTREVNEQTRDLRKTNLELITQNGRLEQFAYIISHNLRAPMARLVGLSTVLRHANTEDEKNRIIELMVKSTLEFESVLKDLSAILDIQRMNADVYCWIELPTLLQKVMVSLEHEIEQTGARFHFHFPSASLLYSLPQYVESIFFNLISNSLKYRHPDRRPVITIRWKVRGRNIRISLQDNGIGMDLEKYKDNVFSLYKRFHFHVEGKGLGLYLVKTQIEALGGKISVTSKPDVGSTFILDFPEVNVQDEG